MSRSSATRCSSRSTAAARTRAERRPATTPRPTASPSSVGKEGLRIVDISDAAQPAPGRLRRDRVRVAHPDPDPRRQRLPHLRRLLSADAGRELHRGQPPRGRVLGDQVPERNTRPARARGRDPDILPPTVTPDTVGCHDIGVLPAEDLAVASCLGAFAVLDISDPVDAADARRGPEPADRARPLGAAHLGRQVRGDRRRARRRRGRRRLLARPVEPGRRDVVLRHHRPGRRRRSRAATRCRGCRRSTAPRRPSASAARPTTTRSCRCATQTATSPSRPTTPAASRWSTSPTRRRRRSSATTCRRSRREPGHVVGLLVSRPDLHQRARLAARAQRVHGRRPRHEAGPRPRPDVNPQTQILP